MDSFSSHLLPLAFPLKLACPRRPLGTPERLPLPLPLCQLSPRDVTQGPKGQLRALRGRCYNLRDTLKDQACFNSLLPTQ